MGGVGGVRIGCRPHANGAGRHQEGDRTESGQCSAAAEESKLRGAVAEPRISEDDQAITLPPVDSMLRAALSSIMFNRAPSATFPTKSNLYGEGNSPSNLLAEIPCPGTTSSTTRSFAGSWLHGPS